jgi:hypothetical protein
VTTDAATRVPRTSTNSSRPASATSGDTNAMATGWPSVGDSAPLVYDADACGIRTLAVVDLVVGAGRAAALGGQPDQHRGIRRRALLDGGATDEVALLRERDDAAEARLHRKDVPAELVAVERHAGLEAERVAARQPARHHPRAARLAERVPDARGDVGGDVELEAVLTRVAGACDEHRVPLVLRADRPVVLQVRERGDEVLLVVARPLDAEALGLLQHLERVGALQGDEGDVVALVEHLGVERGGAVAQLLGHDLAVRGVRHHHVAVLAGAVDDEVVDHAAVAVEQQRVLRLAQRDRRELARERVVERLGGLGSDDDDLAHVRQVEQARVLAHGVVLGEVARVPHGHLPAGEVGEARAGRAVHLVERAPAFGGARVVGAGGGGAGIGGAGVGGAGFGGSGVGHEFSRVAWAVGGCRLRTPPLSWA